MNLNGIDIRLSYDEKEMLKFFFATNMKWLENNDFGDYKNIKLLGDMYESFINENNLSESNNLMLFLTEIRSFELTAQSEKNNNRSIKFDKNISVRILNDDLNLMVKSKLKEWYHKFMILTPKYVAEINRGISYRIRQRQAEQVRNISDTKNIFR